LGPDDRASDAPNPQVRKQKMGLIQVPKARLAAFNPVPTQNTDDGTCIKPAPLSGELFFYVPVLFSSFFI
jgi:hypothetical protein